jgi:hypothetical protein
MPVKRMIVLANSVKNGEHCVAGKEVLEHGGKISFGGWIRPVSRKGDEGALTAAHCALPHGRLPKIWDVLDIALEEPEGYAPQPENWIIDEDEGWQKVKVESDLPGVPYDNPPNLWIDRSQKNDRVHPDNLAKIGQKASLYFIKPKKLELEFGWATYPGSQPKHRRRARFNYRGIWYDLALTDPAIEAKHCPVFPSQNEPTRRIEVAKPEECALCVSLTRPFPMTNCHHKVIATVIE